MVELADARATHGELSRLLNALPLSNELTRLTAEHATLADLPRPPSEWFPKLPTLLHDETRLQTLMDISDGDITRIQSEVDDITADVKLMALAPRIEALQAGNARYVTALDDLPKRRTAVAEQDAILSRILASLEKPGYERPEELLVPASLTGTIQHLIETRSGVDAEWSSAERELRRATENVERLREEAEGLARSGAVPSPGALAEVEAALARLRGSDLQARLVVGQRTHERLERAYDASLVALGSWVGDASALQSTSVIDPRQLEKWRSQADAIDKQVDDHRGRLRDLITERRQAEAGIAALEQAGPIDDAEARVSRRSRDDAWAEHRRSLDDASAGMFETRMRHDDDLSERRLSRSRDLAELRQLKTTVANTAASIERHEELLAEATGEHSALFTRITAAVPDGLSIDNDASPGELLAALQHWTTARTRALEAWHVLQQSADDMGMIRDDLARQQSELASAMAGAGIPEAATLAPAALLQSAGEFVMQAANLKAAQATLEQAHAAATRDLAERQRDHHEARIAIDGWQASWNDALSRTWFAEKADTASVREILKVLAELPATLREREHMAQRVLMMERDQSAFQSAVSSILDELGAPSDGADAVASANTLIERLNANLQAHQLRTRKLADLERASDSRRELEQQLAIHEAAKAELTGFFGTDTLANVSAYLDQAREKERLEQRISTLKDQLANGLRVPTFAEAEALLSGIDASAAEHQMLELSGRIDDLTERSKLLYAEMTRAQDRLDDVGGDDAVARIEARRRTTLLQIEDLAIRYLRLKTGTLAAESALHVYREKHRSSMMNRASEAFRLITGGNYSGLSARPDKDKEILIGVPRDGGSKLADHMSTGTQFQLYLALRVAGYEEFAKVRPPVPFVSDDIMESFDNPRSEEVFRLFGEMAGVGQVIYLTHHQHLCDIARTVVPSVRIHQLP
jgi:uncharacterized protein YhaN